MKKRLLELQLTVLPAILALVVILSAIAQADPVGLWEFDDPADLTKASVGSALTLTGSDAAVSGVSGEDGAASIGIGSYYACTHGIAANGGGSNVNEWTLLLDISYPQASSGLWMCLYQTDTANGNDGECFIQNGGGAIGISGTGYAGSTSADTWYRVVISVDNGSFYNIYVDGQLWLNGTAQAVDSNFSLEQVLLLFADENSEDNEIYVSTAAIWGEALDENTISAYGAADAPLVDPMTVDVGPYVQFTDPTTAIVRWDTTTATDSIVEYGPSVSLGQRVSDAALTTTHEVTITDLKYRRKSYIRVGGTDGGGEVFTPAIRVDNAINYSRLDMSGMTSPYPVDSMTPVYEAAADRIIAQSGVTSGYCLDYGCGTGRLAFEVAKRSNLTIIGVESNSANVTEARSKLLEAGVYSARIKVREYASLSSTMLPKNFFNLIISDSMVTDSLCPGSSAEMFRTLRPDGGIAYLGQASGTLTQATLEAWLDAGSVSYTTTNDGNGLWSKVERDPTTGSGEWVRNWGGLGNCANSFDEIEGARSVSDLRVQWIGAPGEDFGFDRSPRMPTPSMKHGYLYHQGYDRLISMDSYNGSIHWSLEIPDLMRVNTPRDSGYMCADTDGIYVALDDDCLYFDGDTGLRTITQHLNDDGKEWGYVAITGNNLIGSAQFDNAHHSTLWGDAGWADSPTGSGTNKVCSKYMFANDKATGTRTWTDTRALRGTIINSTIAIGGGRVYFVECRDATVAALTTGNIGIAELWNSLYLVALNENTGSPIFEQSISVADGTSVFYLQYYDEKLFITASNTDYDIYAYNATNGSAIWNKKHNWHHEDHGGHMQHPVIVNNVLYLVPNAYDINSGSVVTTNVGVHTKCATYGGTKNFLVYRDVSWRLTLWDLVSETKSSWADLRSSCWLNHISGGGMYLAPEGAAGCSCGGWLNTSLGYVRDN